MDNLPTIQQNRSLLPSPTEWSTLKEQVSMYVKSGFLPSSVKTPEQGVTIAMKGWELGIPPMQAFSHINVISGKPTISAELMLALIYSKVPGATVNFLRSDDKGCELEARRPGRDSKFSKFAFLEKDAVSAQLLSKDNWKKHPAAMFRARAISAMARAMFPDALMGCSYVPEELNPDIQVNEDGHVVEVPVERVSDEPKATPSERAELEKAIRHHMKEVQWGAAELNQYCQQAFEKKPRELTNEELEAVLTHLYEQS